jgi:hypothetical protein
MSNAQHQNTIGTPQRVSTETKAAFKTTELIAYVVVVIGVLIASAISDGNSEFGSKEAWTLVTILTVGYLVSRGLAKSGSRDFYDRDDANRTDHSSHSNH